MASSSSRLAKLTSATAAITILRFMIPGFEGSPARSSPAIAVVSVIFGSHQVSGSLVLYHIRNLGRPLLRFRLPDHPMFRCADLPISRSALVPFGYANTAIRLQAILASEPCFDRDLTEMNGYSGRSRPWQRGVIPSFRQLDCHSA